MKKNLLSLFAALITVFLFKPSFSQENYVPGYIIEGANDTLHGFIDYRYWDMNPQLIGFKISMDDSPDTYSPMDIHGFGIQGDIYKSALVEVETSSRNNGNLDNEPDLHFRKDTAFLRVLILGKKSVYLYVDKFAAESFYIETGSEFKLLIYKKYILHKDGLQVLKETKTYIGQLIYYFETLDMNSRIQSSSYNKRSITSVFKSYYSGHEDKIEFKYKRPKEEVRIDFGPVIGFSKTSFDAVLKSRQNNTLTATEFSSTTNFSGGVFMFGQFT